MKEWELGQLLRAVRSRFQENLHRHKGHVWEQVRSRLERSDRVGLESLRQMEASGGEPDVIGYDEADGKYTLTSSWVQTPGDIRALGGALFCDRRYGQVFVYHNGAQSYYAARGFRGLIRL